MSHLARLAIALMMSTLGACGGKSNGSPDDDGRGGTSAGATGTGATGTGATGTGATGTGATGRYGVYPKPNASPGPNAGDAELPAPGDAIAVLAVELVFTEKSRASAAACRWGSAKEACQVRPRFDT